MDIAILFCGNYVVMETTRFFPLEFVNVENPVEVVENFVERGFSGFDHFLTNLIFGLFERQNNKFPVS